MALSKKEMIEFRRFETFVNQLEEKKAYAAEEHIAPFEREGLVKVNRGSKDQNGNVLVYLVSNNNWPQEEEEEPIDAIVVGEMLNNIIETIEPEFQIDNNVPIPAKSRTVTIERKLAYPFDKIEVGQSFFVPNGTKGKQGEELFKNVNNSVNSYLRQFATPSGKVRTTKTGKVQTLMQYSKKYAIRQVDGGVRVWRTD